MSFPTAFFLDTSIFDGQHYNFDSTAFSAFLKVATDRELTLLLPDVTEQEIKRHMDARVLDFQKTLEKARKTTPFLSNLKHFPPDQTSSSIKHEITREAITSWRSFLSKFNIKRIDYSGVDLRVIMRWYDHVIPPFGAGEKRKEFPDAIVIAMLENYARTNKCVIAIVSLDKDFKHACERFSSLLYFSSLSELTQHLLSDSSVFDSIHDAICKDLRLIESALHEDAGVIDFSHYERKYSIRQSAPHNIEVKEIFIIGLGVNECTFTFTAELEAEHLIEWQEYDRDGDVDICEEWVYEISEFSGIAKVSLDEKTHIIKDIKLIESDINDIEIEVNPRDRW
jgi:hypothetical protein